MRRKDLYETLLESMFNGQIEVATLELDTSEEHFTVCWFTLENPKLLGNYCGGWIGKLIDSGENSPNQYELAMYPVASDKQVLYDKEYVLVYIHCYETTGYWELRHAPAD